MNETIAIIECIATVVSLIISIMALIKSYHQTKLSNKQNLFNERVKTFLITNGLIKLYKSNKELLEKENEDKVFFLSYFILESLINNSYLEKMGAVINKPLHQPEQKDFLSKIEELKNEALKIKFIFKGKSANYLSFFVESYAELLMGLYQYTVLIDSMRKIQDQNHVKEDIHKIAKEVNENERREDLFNKFKMLVDSYNTLERENIIKKIEKQIKL